MGRLEVRMTDRGPSYAGLVVSNAPGALQIQPASGFLAGRLIREGVTLAFDAGGRPNYDRHAPRDRVEVEALTEAADTITVITRHMPGGVARGDRVFVLPGGRGRGM
jgi:hypothetical protein